MPFCKECGAKLDVDAKFCQECGKEVKKEEIKNTSSSNGIIKKVFMVILGIILFAISIACIIYAFSSDDTEYKEFSKYQELDAQVLFNDYQDNEIAAKEKYENNYYYFTGTIYDITEFLNDQYVTIRYQSERDELKTIELLAYFNSRDELTKIKKGDVITIYGKFDERSTDDFLHTLTSFRFHSCRIKEQE